MRQLLGSHHYLLDELVRRRVLEEAEFDVDREEVRNMARVRDLAAEDLLEPAIDALPVEAQRYFQSAIEKKQFNKAADEVIYAIGADLIGASLTELTKEEEMDEYGIVI